MSELFPEQAMSTPSPRLTWLYMHNLALGELPSGLRFCAASDRITTAHTHLDAELLMATELEVEHYSIEGARKAGVLMPGDVVEESW